MWATHYPPAADLLEQQNLDEVAWKSKPSWYIVANEDRTVQPDLERFLAARMKATTVELDAGHLSLVSHAQEITDLILAAAGRSP